MKSITTLIGILLIVFGVVTLSYQGITYTQREQVAQIGELKISADTKKTVYFPPILGALCLVAGIVLVIVGKRNP